MNEQTCFFQFLQFLYYNSNDLDKAAKRLENYFKTKRDLPQFFKNRDLQHPNAQSQLNTVNFVMLPPLSDTTGLVFHRLSNYDPDRYDPMVSAKVLAMFVGEIFPKSIHHSFINKFHSSEAYMCLTGTYKIVAVVDVSGSTLRHVLKIPFWEFRKGLKYYENAMPIKIEALHVLNTKNFIVKMFGELSANVIFAKFPKFLS